MSKKYRSISEKLLEWYEENKNDYPWRETDDLYQILITEILLQKTIAVNVNNLYIKFFKKYKDFSVLNQKEVSEIQADIEVLGLSNKRAQILKDLSTMILEDYNGVIPKDPILLTKVKGIADYVSNAYLCFGLNKRTLFIDVNIKRIVLRLSGAHNKKVKRDFIIEKLDLLVPEKDCKHFYWAILDFGSKICSKKSPKCGQCLINKNCKYFK